LGGLQESWPSTYLDGPQWHGWWKRVTDFYFRCSC